MTEAFVPIAKSLARTRGYPDLPMVVVPHPFETLSADKVQQFARDSIPELMDRLLRPGKAPYSLEDE